MRFLLKFFSIFILIFGFFYVFAQQAPARGFTGSNVFGSLIGQSYCQSGGEVLDQFTTSGGPFTWTIPQGVKKIKVQVWGAGGSGGVGYNAPLPNSAGGGGGGGGYAEAVLQVNKGSVYKIMVGKGGKPSLTSYNTNGKEIESLVSPRTIFDLSKPGLKIAYQSSAGNSEFGINWQGVQYAIGAGGGGAGGSAETGVSQTGAMGATGISGRGYGGTLGAIGAGGGGYPSGGGLLQSADGWVAHPQPGESVGGGGGSGYIIGYASGQVEGVMKTGEDGGSKIDSTLPRISHNKGYALTIPGRGGAGANGGAGGSSGIGSIAGDGIFPGGGGGGEEKGLATLDFSRAGSGADGAVIISCAEANIISTTLPDIIPANPPNALVIINTPTNADGSYPSGVPVIFKVEPKNIGTTFTSPTFNVKLQAKLASDPDINHFADLNYNSIYGGLKQDETKSVEIQHTSALDDNQRWDFRYCVDMPPNDGKGLINELQSDGHGEDNNCSDKITIQFKSELVIIPTSPDLVPVNAPVITSGEKNTDDSYVSGTPVTFEVYAKNTGTTFNGPTFNVKLQAKLSSDPDINHFADLNYNSISGGVNQGAVKTTEIKHTSSVGDKQVWDFRYCVDFPPNDFPYHGRIEESNEGNNCSDSTVVSFNKFDKNPDPVCTINCGGGTPIPQPGGKIPNTPPVKPIFSCSAYRGSSSLFDGSIVVINEKITWKVKDNTGSFTGDSKDVYYSSLGTKYGKDVTINGVVCSGSLKVVFSPNFNEF
ncbi:MAG: hypothetical protein NUV47_01375 [Patescibacteria group bacterium]|nr:hypothetical protein [Patescibacteria group bacterium]